MAVNKNSKAAAERRKKILRVKIVIFAVILLAYGVSVIFFRNQIDRALNLARYGTADIANIKGGNKEGFAAGKLKVHYVDVGQGDAAVIELPDDKTMVIDGGPAKAKEQFLTYMADTLPEIDGFDYVILTHSDEDHCGGLDEIIKKFPVREGGRIYRPNQLSTYKGFTDPALSLTGIEGFWGNYGQNAGQASLNYKQFIELAYKQQAEIKNVAVYVTDARNPDIDISGDMNGDGDADDYEDYKLTFYGPEQAAWKGNNNNYSPIFSLDYQGRRFMFTGDAEKECEKLFADAVQSGGIDFGKKADVINLGHHGSETSTSKEYLNTVLQGKDNPTVLAVISCGANNSYGHPHQSTIDRLIDYGITEEHILRTDKAGTIVIAVSGGDLIYGTVVVSQSDEIKLLSWTVIGGAIVLVIFVLLFLVKKVNIKI